MKKAIEHSNIIENPASLLPKDDLWGDLRAEQGNGGGLQWLFLYEHDSSAVLHPDRLIYVKIIILTSVGRKNAENGQAAILMKCNLHKFETALFSKALALAMSSWDSNNHGRN